MKRKVLLIAMVIAACSFAGAGSLAYFTANEQTENVITAGNVKILLCRETKDGKPYPGGPMKGIMPGQVAEQTAYVKNTGLNTAWIRVRPVTSAVLADGREIGNEEIGEQIRLVLNEDDWVEQDGWYYCLEPVEAGSQTADFFTAVVFAQGMGNEYKKCTVLIQIDAQGVQWANNGSNIWEAAGWPEE